MKAASAAWAGEKPTIVTAAVAAISIRLRALTNLTCCIDACRW
jgi:hypothetical protein